jgi:TolB-like protein/AraC-like DNA-binding protein
MNAVLSIDQAFIKKLNDVIDLNLENEQFGVTELTEQMNMSRSLLHRKLNKLTGKSTSQYIREYRLEKAIEMLQNDVATVSEIAYRVGFSSPTYFNTSFHNYYGYPPGEARAKSFETKNITHETDKKPAYNRIAFISAISLLIIIVYFIYATGDEFSTSSSEVLIKDKSIAVLPPKNLSGDKENQYFADGIMDDILNHLSAIQEFNIISRTTMEQYRNTNKTIPEIAKDLHVSYILESSIQKYNDSVKIIAQLIDAKNDKHIWSKKFKSEFNNIFALESEIAKQIATELKATLSPEEIKKIKKVPTKNLEAYNLYLKGKYFLNLFSSGENIEKSIQYFEESIEKDPEFALAYAALAEAYLFLADSKKVELQKIKNLAMRSIDLDSNIAEAHSTLGAIACWYEWHWEKAEKEYELAIQINPNSSNAYINYSYFLYYVKGSFDEARKRIDKAKSLDPLSLITIMRSSEFYLFEGHFEQALRESQKAIELDKFLLWPYWVNFECYFRQGFNEKAMEALITSWKMNDASINDIESIKNAYNNSGIKGVYLMIINQDLKEFSKPLDQLSIGYINYQLYWIAQKYAFIEDNDKALEFLEYCFEARSTILYHIKYDPYFKNIRTEPRFLAILKKMNLGDYQSQQTLHINLLD